MYLAGEHSTQDKRSSDSRGSSIEHHKSGWLETLSTTGSYLDKRYGTDAEEDEIPANCPLRASVKAAGCVNGTELDKMHSRLTKIREDKRFDEMLEEAALHCRGNGFWSVPQHIKAFLSADRFSQQFVAAPATKAQVLDDTLFQECWASYGNAESPVCTMGRSPLSGRGRRSGIVSH